MIPQKEEWYCWRVFVKIEGCDDLPRLLVPCSDPQEYEYPSDFIFETIEQAITYKAEAEDSYSKEETDNWILVKMTLKPIFQMENGEYTEEEKV